MGKCRLGVLFQPFHNYLCMPAIINIENRIDKDNYPTQIIS